MSKVFRTITEQVVQALRDGLSEGRWQGSMPGSNSLAAEFGVNHKTVKAALGILTKEGLLESHGPGRKRSIVAKTPIRPAARRIMILLYERSDLQTDYLVEILYRLQAAGHWAGFASKTLLELGMSVDQIARFVARTKADAWIVVAGRRDILEWFAAQPLPAFALFGRSTKVSIASVAPSKNEASLALVDRLVALGHRRIVMLGREDRRKPTLGMIEQEYLARLESHGIHTGPYNLPDWGDNPDALGQCLSALFRHTPPTALIVGDAAMFPGVLHHLARLRFSTPNDVSLACTDYSTAFDWCRPNVTHITWNHDAAVRRVVGWVNRISSGKEDCRCTRIPAELVAGGTIGPAPRN